MSARVSLACGTALGTVAGVAPPVRLRRLAQPPQRVEKRRKRSHSEHHFSLGRSQHGLTSSRARSTLSLQPAGRRVDAARGREGVWVPLRTHALGSKCAGNTATRTRLPCACALARGPCGNPNCIPSSSIPAPSPSVVPGPNRCERAHTDGPNVCVCVCDVCVPFVITSQSGDSPVRVGPFASNGHIYFASVRTQSRISGRKLF